jgi:four helix bundle protein
MEKESILQIKSKLFALEIIKICKIIKDAKVLTNQLLRSGTSIGANIYEGKFAVSSKDFLNKLLIALKEASETAYWLDLLFQSKYIDNETYYDLNEKCSEIIKILTASTKTIKGKYSENYNDI